MSYGICLKSENNFIFEREMIMFLQILGVITIVAYVAFNLIVANTHTAKEMFDEFIKGQCIAGMIFANLFYAPAWILKMVRGFVVTVVK
jgi:hypothetical protein